jgi:hypothetical protein
VRQDGLAAGAGVAANQSLDVDSGPGDQQFERFEEIMPSGIAVPLVRMRRQL